MTNDHDLIIDRGKIRKLRRRNDEQAPGEDPFFTLPVIFDIDGAPRIFFIGWYIRDAQRHDQAPRLTAPQVQALELLESIANDPSFYLQMEFQPGDIQLLNNAKILHAREAYTDYDDPGRAPAPAALVADRPRVRQRRRHTSRRNPGPAAGELTAGPTARSGSGGCLFWPKSGMACAD